MAKVLTFQPKILKCYACEIPMDKDDDGNYQCTTNGCAKGRIASKTGIKVSREGKNTILEPA